MKGLLYAESEQKRLVLEKLSYNEIYTHLSNIYINARIEDGEGTGWLEGTYDYCKYFKLNHPYILK